MSLNSPHLYSSLHVQVRSQIPLMPHTICTSLLFMMSLISAGCEDPRSPDRVASLDMMHGDVDNAVPNDQERLSDLDIGDVSSSDQGAEDQGSPPLDIDLSDVGVLDTAHADAELEFRDMSVNPDQRLQVRAPCYIGAPVDTGLSPPPAHCIELFERDSTRSSGCYLMRQLDGTDDQGYCWRQKALAFLVNNEIESEIHPDDLDGDGVIDQGELVGQNYPADPLDLSASEVAARIKRDVHAYFAELSYQAVWIDLEIYWAGEGHSERQPPPSDEVLDQERWYRLQRLRPGFANTDFTQDLCRRRGGMSAEDWHSYDWIMTIISHGTTTSGSQYREEDLPVGEQCDETATIQGDYIVMKNFRGWNRLGTLYHEVMHTFSLDPLPEPSIGHSESVSPITGALTEYGDLTDLMGRSRDQGHLSGPQKAFLKHLPPDMIATMGLTDTQTNIVIAPLEPATRAIDERRLLRVEVAEGNAYHVEVRRAIGSDIGLPDIFHQGALIKRARALTASNKSFIVDPTPETISVNSSDYVLLPHRTFSDEMNQVHISALDADERGVTIGVYRGPRSAQIPTIDPVEIQPVYDDEGAIEGWHLIANAQPGIPEIPSQDLLYFWKLGPLLQLYTPELFRYGRRIYLSAAQRPEEVRLLVSDQRGGERWIEVPWDE